MTKNVKIIVLTGSLGSGKSTVASMFEALGARIIDADVLARRVVEPGTPGLTSIINLFGKEFLLPDGSLDRKALGRRIFSNPTDKTKLEGILHPLIQNLHKVEIDKIKASATKTTMALCVIPLFFETNNKYPEVEKVIVVSAPREVSIQRVMKRDSCTRDLAEKKYDSQLPILEKASRADFVIRNDGSKESLTTQVEDIYYRIML